MPHTIVSFGETLWDLLPAGRMLGGAPFNFVYRVNCLGDRGLIVSRLGEDDLGREAFGRIAALGMETTFIQWDPEHPTGTVQVRFDAEGQPDYYIVPDAAYDYVEATDALLDLAGRAECLCFGTLAQRAARSRAALTAMLDAAGDATKLLDLNLRKQCYTTRTVRDSLDKAEVVKLNDDEALAVARMLGLSTSSLPEMLEGIIGACGLRCCVITLGPRGALAGGADSTAVYVPGYQVEVVDPVGSGDAFTAAFIHHYLRGRPLSECCRWGNVWGAMVAASAGGTVPLGPDDAEKFLSSGPARIRERALERLAVE